MTWNVGGVRPALLLCALVLSFVRPTEAAKPRRVVREKCAEPIATAVDPDLVATYRRTVELARTSRWVTPEQLGLWSRSADPFRLPEVTTPAHAQLQRALDDLRPESVPAPVLDALRAILAEEGAAAPRLERAVPAPASSDGRPLVAEEARPETLDKVEPSLTFESGGSRVEGAVFLPGTPSRVATCEGIEVRIFDREKGGAALREARGIARDGLGIHTPELRAVAPNGKFLVAGTSFTASALLRVGGSDRPAPLRVRPGKTGYLEAVAVSADSKRIVGLNAKGEGVVWGYRGTGAELVQEQARIVLPRVKVLDARMRGERLLVLTETGELAEYELPAPRTGGEPVSLTPGRRFRLRTGNATAYSQLRLSPDGKLALASGLRPGSGDAEEPFVWVLDLDTWKEPVTLDAPTEVIHAAHFVPKGDVLVGLGSDEVVLWSLRTGRRQHALRVNRLKQEHRSVNVDHEDDQVFSIAIHPGGEFLVGGTNDGLLVVWEIATGALVAARDTDASEFHALSFSSDGRWLLAGAHLGFAGLFDFRKLIRSRP